MRFVSVPRVNQRHFEMYKCLVLTVIALCLLALVLRTPRPITLADMRAASPKDRAANALRLPLVRVFGSVEVQGSVAIDGSIDVNDPITVTLSR